MSRSLIIGLLLLTWPLRMLHAAVAGTVTLLRTPHGGIQPQAVVDAQGVLHLIYYEGDPAHGDIYYVHKVLGHDAPFSIPIRVNSRPGTAMATGTIRGAQIALGKGGRIHVVWNGVGAKAANGYARLYVAYARLNAGGTAFEPQRNLLRESEAVDGGDSVAADDAGDVYVTWHSSGPGMDEAAGGVSLVRSSDNGSTFTAERRVSPSQTGQCGCCSMRAFADGKGDLYILYRAAGQNVHRDTTLLVSQDRGATFRAFTVQPWTIDACPMSSFSLAEGQDGVVGAWETRGQVYFAPLTPGAGAASAPIPAPDAGQRKYPVVVSGSGGRTLLAWVEGAGWGHGGTVAWQIYDRSGKMIGPAGRADGVPTWSLVSAVARPDGAFLIIY